MNANEYAAYTNSVHVTIGEDDEKTFKEYIKEAFEAGMEEYEKRLRNSCLEGRIVDDGGEVQLVVPELPIITRNMDDGDEVKVIIIKE